MINIKNQTLTKYKQFDTKQEAIDFSKSICKTPGYNMEEGKFIVYT